MIGARHKQTRPFPPQTNGRAERCNATLLAEWPYARLYETSQARLDTLPAWLDHYDLASVGETLHLVVEGRPPAPR